VDDSCIAGGDADCFWSEACRDEGRCREVAGMCMATQDRDCRRSRACRLDDRCTVDEHDRECVDERPRRNRALLALGIVGTSLGGAATFAGIVYAGITYDFWDNPESSLTPVPAYVLLGAGIPTLALSLTGLIYGAGREEKEPSAVPTIGLGPTGGSLTWSF
jgi:hypothetical protein